MDFWYCQFVGAIRCQGDSFVGSGVLINVKGAKHDVIATVAHSVLKPAGVKRENCNFYSGTYGTMVVPIDKWITGTPDPFVSDTHGNILRHDWAVGRLQRRISLAVGGAGYLSLTDEMLTQLINTGKARFLLVGYHPAERRLMVADGCQPVPTQPGDFREEVTEQYRHNCNAINGFSGAPLFVVTPDFDGVICLHSSSADLGTQAPQIFNRSANANSCEKISPEVIQALNTLAYSD